VRNKILGLVLLLGFVWGLEQVVVSPLETGTAYPEYSSLRSDPEGAMALYESLAKVMKVERLYKSRLRSDPGPESTIFVLGVEPQGWYQVKSDTLKEYEELTSKGARLVIAFLPVSKPWAEDKEPHAVEAKWHIHFNYRDLHADSGETPRETALVLKAGPEWNQIREGVVERKLGAGTVVLVADSYPLSNEGLREEHDTALIVKLAGPATEIVFDENHFGVVETGSVAKLMRKYHLEGALAVLALVAGLFLWRSASSLLPSRAPRAEQPVSGRDSLEGMAALLRRGIAEQDLVRICYEEWKRTSLNDLKSLDKGLHEALIDHKNVVTAYREVQRWAGREPAPLKGKDD
jgi:hypothetical protein